MDNNKDLAVSVKVNDAHLMSEGAKITIDGYDLMVISIEKHDEITVTPWPNNEVLH